MPAAKPIDKWQLFRGFGEGGDAAPPKIGAARMVRLAWRTWPFMRPLWPHLLAVLALGAFGILIWGVGAALGTDLIINKVLVGDALQPVQARLLFLDDGYVGDPASAAAQDAAAAATDAPSLAKIPPPAAESEPALTPAQRKTVRNRLIPWALALSAVGLLAWAFIEYYVTWLWQSVNQNLRVAMMTQAERVSLKYHDDARVGDAIFRIYQDSAMIVNVVQSVVVTPLRLIYGLAMGLFFIVVFDPFVVLVVVLAMIPMVAMTAFFTPRLRRRALANR